MRIGGDFNVAIDSNTRYDMAEATLELVGLGTAPQLLEVMSTDDGPIAEGLDRTLAGHYPIGIRYLGPAATTVELVDSHDNDGQGQSADEAIYVRELIVAGRVALNLNGFKIYYETLILPGNVDVDVPGNLIPIVSGVPLRPGDCNQDGGVDLSDGIAFLQWFFQGVQLSAPAGSELCLIDPVNATAVGTQSMDWNGDAALDLSDETGLLTWFFGGAAEHVLGQDCILVDSPDCLGTCADGP